MSVPDLALHDGTTIPQLGFGVFQVPPEETEKTVLTAFEVGYRHIDTAEMYQNEEGVGAAVASSGIPRDELYITSKLNNGFHRPDDARRAFDDTMSKLGLDRLDLFLIHWPLPTLYDGDYGSTWRVLGDPVICEIDSAHGKTPSQVTLRWHVERGDIVFPKSMRRERMQENFDVFDFSLSEEEVQRISSLDKGEDGRTGPNPNDFDYIPD